MAIVRNISNGTDAGVHCHLDLLALCDVQQGQEGQRAPVKRAQDPTIEQFSTIPTIEKSPSVQIIEAENLIRLQSAVPLKVGLESDSEELD